MPIPPLTHLQFLVLDVIGGVERPGRMIRSRLAEERVLKSPPAFYMAMSRLVDAGFVESTPYKIDVAGQPAVERRYKVTGAGRRAWEATRDFYTARPSAAKLTKGGLARA